MIALRVRDARDASRFGGKPLHRDGWLAPLEPFGQINVIVLFTGGVALVPCLLAVIVVAWRGAIVVRRLAGAMGFGRVHP